MCLFSFLWLYNQPFYMPPNLPRALGKGAVSSFFLSSHNLHLLPHAWSDFDQTWSEWPVGKWLQKLCFVWPQRSCRGHRGQKCHFFYRKCYSSFMFYWIFTTLDQNDQWISGYKMYQQFDLKGHVEITGVKKVNHVKNIKTAPI